MVSKIALSGFNGVSAIDLVPVAQTACVAGVGINGHGAAIVLAGEFRSCSYEHESTRHSVKEPPAIANYCSVCRWIARQRVDHQIRVHSLQYR
jgi:hypothetical protein